MGTFHVTQTVMQNPNNLHAQCAQRITKPLFNLVIIVMLLQTHVD